MLVYVISTIFLKQSPSTEWLKVELLLEFAQWLCVKDFPLEDCTDQVDWAIDIMQNMQAAIDLKKEEGKLVIQVHL